jgi:hypothetical protein
MGLKHSFVTARKRIEGLDADERKTLSALCRDIQDAQETLTKKATRLLANCVACQGLCCRNILTADIITEWDLVYLLVMAPAIESAMADCLAGEGFFPADCLFLQNGIGPCLFPDNLRPERCIISFCRVEPSIEKEIGRVMGGFSRLIRFFMFRPLRRLGRCLLPLNPAHRRTNG